MACTLEIRDPNYDLLVKKYNGDVETALVQFLQNYDNLKAPKHQYKNGLEGKIIYTNSYPKHLKNGVIIGDNYTEEEIVKFNKRGFTVIGSSKDVRKLATATDIQQDRLTIIAGAKSLERVSTVVELSKTDAYDKLSMLQNLNLAIELEQQGKDRKRILSMTGWQRSQTDKMWRYEIPETDLILSEFDKIKADSDQHILLSSIVPATDPIFSLYPELLKVKVKKLSSSNPFNTNTGAAYNPKTKTISLKESKLESKLKAKLYHEVQHAIQEIEGFPLGGNYYSAIQFFSDEQIDLLSKKVEGELKELIYTAEAVKSFVEDLTEKQLNEVDKLQKELERIKLEFKMLPKDETASEENSRLTKERRKIEKQIFSIIGKEINDNNILNILNSYVYENIPAKEKAEKIKGRLALFISTKKSELKKVKAQDKTALVDNMNSSEAYEYYTKLAGEVEARNVEARLNFSKEKRKATLLEETAGIAPEEQIIIFSYPEETVQQSLNDVVESLKNVNTSSEIDTFLELFKGTKVEIVFDKNSSKLAYYKDGVIYINPVILKNQTQNILDKELSGTPVTLFSNIDTIPQDVVTKLIIAHELVHALTVTRIKDYLLGGKSLTKEEYGLIDQLYKIYKQVQPKLKDDSIDFYEFVSRALTSPAFAVKLQQIQYEEKSLLHHIWDFISSLFGIVDVTAGALVRKLLETNYDTHKETLHSFGEEFNFTGVQPNLELLDAHYKGETAKIRKRIGVLKAQTNQYRHNTKLSNSEKISKIAEIAQEIEILQEKEQRFRFVQKKLQETIDFNNFQNVFADSFYKADVDEIILHSLPYVEKVLSDTQNAIRSGREIEPEKLMRALEELDAVSFAVEKWKAYAAVDSEEAMKNHLFTPYATLKHMANEEEKGTSQDLTNKYKKYFLAAPFTGTTFFDPRGITTPNSSFTYSLDKSMPKIENRYLDLRLQIIRLLVNNSAPLQLSGVFSPTPYASEILTGDSTSAGSLVEGNVLKPVNDMNFFEALFAPPGKSMANPDALLASVIKMKMDEVDNVAISDFNKLTSELNDLYRKAKAQAAALGTTITELFSQKVSLAGIDYLTGNVVERTSDLWNKIYSENITKHRERLNNIEQDRLNNVIDDRQYETQINNEMQRFNQWMLQNMEIIDLGKVDDIRNYVSKAQLEAEHGLVLGGRIYDALMRGASPQDNTYKQYLIDTYGQQHYDETIKEQKEQIDIYISTLAATAKNLTPSTLNQFLKSKGFKKVGGNYIVDNVDDAFMVYALTTSPFLAHNSYYSTVTESYPTTISGKLVNLSLSSFRFSRMSEGKKYVKKIPRKYQGVAAYSNGKWAVKDKLVGGVKQETPYYDSAFDIIENNPEIKEYYDKFKEVLITANSWQPLHRTRGLRTTSLPLLEMQLTDIILSGDKNNGGWKYFLTSRLRAGFRKFINDVFKSFFTPGEETEPEIKSIKKKNKGLFSNVKNKSLSFERLYTLKLNEYLRSPGAITSGAGFEDAIRRIQYETADEITREHNMDMHKLILYYAKFMSLYSHKENSMPLMEAMNEVYGEIKTPKGTPRTRSIERMKYTYNLWKFQPKHAVQGRFGKKRVAQEDEELAKRLDEAIVVANAAGDIEQAELLSEWRSSLDRTLSRSKLIDNLLITPKRYLLIAAAPLNIIMNRFQGIHGNDILAASANENWFLPEELEMARSLMTFSMVKFWSGGLINTYNARKVTNILKKLDALEDMTDEVEKAGGHNWWERANLSNLVWLGQRSTEFLNQGEIIIASILHKTLTNSSGTKTIPLFYLLDDTGELSTWAKAEGFEFSWDNPEGVLTASKAKALRNSSQGDYTLGGTPRVKQTDIGRLASLFMTWVPEFLFLEYANKQVAPHIGEFIGTSRGLTKGQFAAKQSIKTAKAWSNPFSIVLPMVAGAFGLTALAPAIGIVSTAAYLGATALETIALYTVLRTTGDVSQSEPGLRSFLSDYAYMMRATAQRTLYRMLKFTMITDLPFDVVQNPINKYRKKLNSQFDVKKYMPTGVDTAAERQAMRRAAEQGSILTSFMIAQTLLLLLLFDEDDKEAKDNPLLNFLSWSIDKITNDIAWHYSAFAKFGLEGENIYSSIGQDPFSTIGKAFDLIHTIAQKSQTYDYINRDEHAYKPESAETSLQDVFKKSITPNAILQTKAVLNAYKYSYGEDRPFDKIGGSSSERTMQKQATQEHGKIENRDIKMKKKLEKREKRLNR